MRVSDCLSFCVRVCACVASMDNRANANGQARRVSRVRSEAERKEDVVIETMAATTFSF